MHPHVGACENDEALETAASYVRAARRLAVLTGAGISAESGLATFRGAGGLWEGHRVEDVATPRAFARDPALVWRFYNLRRANLAQVQPNPGHLALAALEQLMASDASASGAASPRRSDRFALITQNVDGLHQLAGSQAVYEIHGSLRRVRCTGCGVVEERGVAPLADLPHCDRCSAMLRPDVVWFEEMLPHHIWAQAERAALECQCFLVVGTSALVYPAAGLIELAKQKGARVVEVNVQATHATGWVDVSLLGPSGTILPEIVRRARS